MTKKTATVINTKSKAAPAIESTTGPVVNVRASTRLRALPKKEYSELGTDGDANDDNKENKCPRTNETSAQSLKQGNSKTKAGSSSEPIVFSVRGRSSKKSRGEPIETVADDTKKRKRQVVSDDEDSAMQSTRLTTCLDRFKKGHEISFHTPDYESYALY
jgi:hypothetical protein